MDRIESGDLRVVDIEDKHPSSSKAGQPFCTRSQYVRYVNREGLEELHVHQYLLEDGTLGASGRPDPKWIRLGDEVLIPR